MAENRMALIDLQMPEMDGFTVIRTLRQMLPGLRFIVASGRMDAALDQELRSLGVESWLNKPFTEENLMEALKLAIAKPPETQ